MKIRQICSGTHQILSMHLTDVPSVSHVDTCCALINRYRSEATSVHWTRLKPLGNEIYKQLVWIHAQTFNHTALEYAAIARSPVDFECKNPTVT